MKKIFSNIIGNIVYFFKYEYKFVLGAFLALLEFILLYIIFSNIIAFNFSGTLIIFLAIVPWIVFGVFANIKNDKYQKFWFNEKNVQVILNAINSSASASYVVAEYERFISFEKMNYSFMAKYFISDKCKTDKFQYEFAAKEYSLYRFCEFYTLFVYCQEYLLMCDKEAIEVQKILPFLSDTWPLCRIGRAVIRASQSCRQSCNKSQCPACGCRSHHSCTHAPQFSRSFPAREWGSVLQRQGACGQCP